MGAQKNRTQVVSATSEAQWNATMQFLIKDLQEDVLCLTVFDRGHFSPNGEQSNRLCNSYTRLVSCVLPDSTLCAIPY
jgi:hypothetical protein